MRIRGFRFSVRSMLIAVCCTAVILACRHEFVAAWCCFRISIASSAHDANHLADNLWSEPGRQRKLRFAVRLLGRGNRKLDFAVTEKLYWPHHRAVSAGPPAGELDAYLAAVLAEAQTRPEIMDLFIDRERYYLSKVGLNAAAGPHAHDLLSFRSDVGADFDTELSWLLQFAVQCRLTGRWDLAAGLSEDNWEDRARQWNQWMDEHYAYMRFDPRTGRCIVDMDAKKRKAPLPDESFYITSLSTPFRDWDFPAGWDLKDSNNCATCQDLFQSAIGAP